MAHTSPITILSVQGMHCNSCVAKVKTALGPFAKKVTVTLNPPTASLSHANATIDEINRAPAKTQAALFEVMEENTELLPEVAAAPPAPTVTV
ncbi:MAG: hypothetical protein EBU69_03530 [Methylophilaceae bacterium]|nr:hypothetical protein [Methylophilaceae bacterium]